jgi:hypothetical protein
VQEPTGEPVGASDPPAKLDNAGQSSDGGGSDAKKNAISMDYSEDSSLRHTRNALLEQFYSTLTVMYLSAIEIPANASRSPRARREIDELLSSRPKSWEKAYAIEQQLTQIYTPSQIETEWTRRVGEAELLGLPHIAGLTKKFTESTDIEMKRSAIHRLLNDLQWYYLQRIRRRDAAKLLAVRVSRVFWVSFIVFISLLFLQLPLSYGIESAASGRTDQESGK